jgi:uncharacterized membrane protein
MENKNVGYLLLGISIVIVGIIFLFNNAMKEIVVTSCGEAHALVCPMNETIKEQTYLSLSIVAVLFIIAFVLVFSKPKEKIILQKIKVKEKIAKKEIDTSGLRKEDKDVLQIVQASKTIFQADLIEKTGFGKAKMSRILDRLENKGIIERKRRGMTNVVVMKD